MTRRLIAALVWLFPASFRARYGEEIVQVTLGKIEAAHARHGPMRATLHTLFHLADLARSALVERRGGRGGGRRGAGEPWSAVRSDLRLALRGLKRSPGFAAVVIITLGVGIGGTTAVFSVVNGVLLEPLPYERPDELVVLWHRVTSRGDEHFPQSAATYFTYREEQRAFEDLGLWTTAQVSVTGAEEPVRLDAAVVTDGLFPVLGVRPVLGRRFTAEDDSPTGPRTAMISYAYWQSRYGGGREALGSTVRVNGTEYQIVGVLPAGFGFFPSNPSLFFTFRMNPSDFTMGGGFGFQAVARLRPGMTVEDANRDVDRMLPLTVEKYPAPGFSLANLQAFGMEANVIPLADEVVGDVGGLLWILFGTVGIVLVIASVNVANLSLVRAEARRREVAVRTALGAGRGRIAQQMLVESLTLGLVGGLLGVGLAHEGLRLLLHLAPDNLPRLQEITIDPSVLLFALTISLGAGSFFGLFPILTHASSRPAGTLRDSTAGAGTRGGRQRLRTALAVAETALAMILLIGSGLMVRSFVALRAVEPGFERPGEVLTFRLSIPRGTAATLEEVARAHQTILDGLAALPGVTSAGAVSAVALDRRSPSYATHVEGFPVPENSFPPSRRYKWVAGDYFETLENRLIAGRRIGPDDVRDRAKVVMVSEGFAREYWGDPTAAIGRRLRNNPNDPWREIVGVVADIRDDGVDLPAPAIVYWPLVVETFDGNELFVRRTMAYVVRSAVTPAVMIPRLREAVWAFDPDLPLEGMRSLESLLRDSMARTTFTLIMLAIAASVALLLGLVGVYGVVSYVVAQRSREIGVRMALGARSGDVARLVFGHGGLVAALGIGIGVLAALGVTRFMASLLFGVGAVDPVTFASAALAVGSVTLAASYLPARRAAAVDPVRALRAE